MKKIRPILLTIFLSACASLPPTPEVKQCGYSIKFNEFDCVDTKTKATTLLSRSDKRMEAAQCLSADDFKAMEAWVTAVEEIAEQRCK